MSEWKAYVIENHPNDSRVKIKHDGIFQALSGRMGTGGGNTPLILEIRKVRTNDVGRVGNSTDINTKERRGGDKGCPIKKISIQ